MHVPAETAVAETPSVPACGGAVPRQFGSIAALLLLPEPLSRRTSTPFDPAARILASRSGVSQPGLGCGSVMTSPELVSATAVLGPAARTNASSTPAPTNSFLMLLPLRIETTVGAAYALSNAPVPLDDLRRHPAVRQTPGRCRHLQLAHHLRTDSDARHHLPHVDLARRFRRWARPEPGGSAREAWARAPSLASRRRARQRRRRDGGRLAHAPARRVRHGAQYVRADPRRVGRGLARLVGSRAALPRAGVCADPSRSRADRNGRRDRLLLRHRGLRRRLRTSA